MNEQTQKITGVATSALMLATMGASMVAALPASADAAAPAPQPAAEKSLQAAGAPTVKPSQVAGTFAFAQGEVTPLDQIARSMGSADKYLCGAQAVTSNAGALAEVGAWTISIGGAVAHPYDATIEQMVDEESQTVVLGCSCAGNPADGIASVNAQVTGVPVTELLRHADPLEGANTIVFASADGYEVALPLSYVLQHYCPIVFDVNGSPIAESMGGVNQLWLGSTSARYFARDIVSITAEQRDEVPAAPGANDAAGASANLPNVGVFFGGEVA